MTAAATYLIAVALVALVLEHAATHVESAAFGALLRWAALGVSVAVLAAPWVLHDP
jgi:hypothetical protein